jgi:4-hydroxybenzoate polyprenyltransferase
VRCSHWVKNVFVAAPLLFSGRFDEPAAWVQCVVTVAGFCLLASSIYLINDVCDRREDRHHPAKRNRAIASGRVSISTAILTAVTLGVLGIVLCAAVAVLGVSGPVESLRYPIPQPLGGLGLLVWAGGYLVLNLLYSFWLKHRAIIDVIIVAMGFVMRAMAGAAAIAVPISPWLVVCTLTLCLFIAVAKRRSETVEMPPGQADAARKAHRGYEPQIIEHMLTVSAGLAILTYSLYCLAPRTVTNIGSGHMVWTIPLVIYGTFRYYRKIHRPGASDIVAILVRDKIMWLVILGYIALSGIIITYGSHPWVRDILDVEVNS